MRTWIAIPFVLLGGAAAASPPDPAALAARIDRHLEARWAAEKVTPADRADDAAFARRVHLDLIGRIPTAAETRAFLADGAADKREKLVTDLLGSPSHARHAATVWRREWLPQADTAPFAHLGDGFDAWLAQRFRDAVPYDRIVRDLLTAEAGAGQPDGRAAFLSGGETKPENLAANATRAFLGINLDCAQCHDHPFAKWTREQFWQTAAFFTRPTGPPPARPRLSVPGTKVVVVPRLLNDREPDWPSAPGAGTGPDLLARWVTARDNPYFAKNAVNRLWAALFGTGLVEPLDDLGGQTPAAHPELLDDLARAFADSGFDLRYLTAAVVRTRAYQLSSVRPKGGSDDPKLFARAAVRGLTGEQLYDSLRTAAGLPPERADLDSAVNQRARFADRFRVERPGTAQRSIPQALSLMNGRGTADLTDAAKVPTLRAAAGSPFLDTRGRVEALYLAALGREPTRDELAGLVKYVTGGGADGDPRKALADVFWALLNSTEFNTNH